MDKETAVRRAARWWRQFLENDAEIMERWRDNRTPIATALVSIGAPAAPAAEKLKLFERKLIEYLDKWLEPKYWNEDEPKCGGYLRIVSTDKKWLHDLVHDCGISTLLLPPKVHMEISPDEILVGGYGREWTSIDPAKPKQLNETRRQMT